MTRYFLLLILVTALLQACSSRPHVIRFYDPTGAPAINTIYIARHDWHTGFIISAIDAESVLPFLKKRFSRAAFYEFGWGDNGFYRANEITFGMSIKAILWPTDSVMHVVAVPFDPVRYFKHSDVLELKLSDPALYNLLEFIRTSFYYSADDQPVAIDHGIYGDSEFYQGMGDYYLLNTCNRWTAKGLESAGFDIFTFSKFTADSIMAFIRELPATGNPAPD